MAQNTRMSDKLTIFFVYAALLRVLLTRNSNKTLKITCSYFSNEPCKTPAKKSLDIRGLLEKYPTFGREKETGLLGALDT